GAIQFFQAILASSVYNIFFESLIFSPGSTVLFSSTLFTIFLIFHTESIKKTRSLIYGLIFSNIIITVLSYISLEQAIADRNSENLIFLQNIFNFDISLFLTGTSLLYIDSMLLVIFYELLNYKIKGYLFMKIFIVTSVVNLFDSVVFYTLNFFNNDNFHDLLLGNILGKQITVLFFSIIIYIYLSLIYKKERLTKPKNLREAFKIFSF
ncbi:MAG: hypothetical protein ABNG96_08000, partial [Flavobacterium sp.]